MATMIPKSIPIVSPSQLSKILSNSDDVSMRALQDSPITRTFTPRTPFEARKDLDEAHATHDMKIEFDRAIQILGDVRDEPGVLSSIDHRAASLLQTFLVNEAKREDKIHEVGSTRGVREVQFDERDWAGWAKSFFSWWKGISPHPWLDTPTCKTIKNKSRIAVLGDWGTGAYGAPICARSIERSRDEYDALVHLGDVYYSGDTNEIRERFLNVWMDPTKTSWSNKNLVLHRACNSNHEMYTGGHAYFNHTLSKFEQSASYFAFQNDHWIFVGLDTGYKEGDLMGQQTEWLADLVANAGDRRIVLFSHHQPFSWFEKSYTRLTDKLSSLLTGQKIFAWYWGHEHRCILYDKHERFGVWGRCVGHSGYPYFRDSLESYASEQTLASKSAGFRWALLPTKRDCPSAKMLDGPNPYVQGFENKYGSNGYMTLDLDGPQLVETVHSAEGEILYSRSVG